MDILGNFLSSNGLMPHGFCYQWKPALIWLHAISDGLIAFAYFLIPVALIYFERKRRDVPFGWMFVTFGVFIAACGATHIMDVWTLWVPSHWISGGVKVLTALASVPAAIFLVRLMPAALSLPSYEEARTANEQLRRQAATLKESEHRFRQMAENIQEIFWMMNAETKEVTYANPAFERICELPLDSLYSNPTSYRELIHPDDRQRVLAGLEKLESTNGFDEEFRIVCPSGTVKWLRALGFIAKNSTGGVLSFVGTAQEITAAKEMEVGLRESEDRYRDLVEHSTDLICTYDLQGYLLSVNELPARLLGYSREELLSKPMRDFLLPEARAQFEESLLSIKRDGFVKGLMVVLTKTGERRIWEYHNTLRTEGVTVPIVRGVAHDITNQKHMEKALRLSEEKFEKAFRSSPIEIVITTFHEGLFLDANQAFERNSGFTREEILGRTHGELGIWEDPDGREAVIEQIKQHGKLQDWEISFRTKTGNTRLKRYSAEQLKIGGRQCLLEICEDITLRKQVEAALRISEEKFSKAFRSSPSVISISTLERGIILEINESFERQTGYARDELLGRTALDVGLWIDPSERQRLVNHIEKYGHARNQEIHFRDKSGQVAVLQISAELIELDGEKCLLTVGQDITERKRAEKELLETKVRMETVLDSVADVHILFDRNWRYLYVNQAAVRATGRPPEQILGRTLWELYPDIAGTELDRQYHRAMDERVPCIFDFYHAGADTWWENRFYPGPEGLAVFATDITKSKQAEEALRKTEEQFSAILNHSPNLIFLKDVEGRYLFINKEYLKTFHFNREQIYGRKDVEIFPPDQAVLFRGSDLQVLRARVPMEFEEVALRDDGPHTSIVQKVPLFDARGEIYATCGFVTDITERKRAEEELRRLSGQLLKLQDEERRRIARDLHDSTGQDLVALATTLSQLHASIPSSSRKVRKLASQCEELADRCLHEVRTLSYLLHPAMLDETGLEDAIRHYADGFAERTGIEVELEISPLYGRTTPDIELALFRVVQESLTNIQRHSGSFVAQIRLDRMPGIVSLEVSDKGHGATGEALQRKGALPFEVGVGIPSMQERVKLIGGRLDIESSHNGTTVRVAVPLDS